MEKGVFRPDYGQLWRYLGSMRRGKKTILEKLARSVPGMPMPPEPPDQPDPEVTMRKPRKNPPGMLSGHCPAGLPATGQKWKWRKFRGES